MSELKLIQWGVDQFHTFYLDSVKDLTDEQLHFRPDGNVNVNHIAFILWHLVQTEDMTVKYCRDDDPKLWQLAADPELQGTGMTVERAAAVRIENFNGFKDDMENIFSATEAYLKGLNPGSLDQICTDVPEGLEEWTKFDVIGKLVYTHLVEHIGEIWYIKGLMGLEGCPI